MCRNADTNNIIVFQVDCNDDSYITSKPFSKRLKRNSASLTVKFSYKEASLFIAIYNLKTVNKGII